MSTTTALTAPKTDTRKPYEIPTRAELKATGKRGLYGDEWDGDLRAIVCEVFIGANDSENGNKNCQAKFEAVVHPENYRDFCVTDRNGGAFSVMRVELVWHSFAQNSGDGAPLKGEEGKDYHFQKREHREVNQHARVKGNLGCRVGIWDIDNTRRVYAIRVGDKGGKLVWMDRRYIELANKGRAVRLPSGITGYTTRPL
jgi:hypothetical protein